MSLQSINPFNGELIQEYQAFSSEQIKSAVEDTHQAFLSWRKTSFDHRAGLMRRIAAILRNEAESAAKLMAVEMGKPIREGRSEVEKCAWVCEYYAEHAEHFLMPELVKTEASKSFVSFQPMGLVLAVMPWNFPLWQVFRFAAPALMAGNGALLKHASNVSGCALLMERLFIEAGFPAHLFTTLLIPGQQVAEVIENPRVSAVTLTGSTPAGKAVASKAGAMLKKSVLELGGSDPYIILEDADLEQAVAACVTSRLINGGQSCIAAKRFIVQASILDEFETRFVAAMANKTVGDPMLDATDIGPQARHELRDELHQQVIDSLAKGGQCLLGGEIPEGPGAFYPPTVLTRVRKGMPAYDEELFGPVAAIIAVDNLDQAVAVANDSVFGLGAAIFTGNVEKGLMIAESQLEAGCCFVNEFVKSDPRLPFGGIKQSGFGRELSHFGIREFVNIKTVYQK